VPNIRIRFHPAAAAEVEAAVQWYAERSPVAARAFASEVNACVERVGEAPDRWPRYVHGTRRSPVWDSRALVRCRVVPLPVRPSTSTWEFLASQAPQFPGHLTVDHGTATAYSNRIASASGD
jgi:plasmid stabilization system protein ParE